MVCDKSRALSRCRGDFFWSLALTRSVFCLSTMLRSIGMYSRSFGMYSRSCVHASNVRMHRVSHLDPPLLLCCMASLWDSIHPPLRSPVFTRPCPFSEPNWHASARARWRPSRFPCHNFTLQHRWPPLDACGQVATAHAVLEQVHWWALYEAHRRAAARYGRHRARRRRLVAACFPDGTGFG